MKRTAIAILACIGLAGAASAQVNVSSDITVSTTWTANNVYNLTTQIYVKSGATLTIEPGTLIASTPTINGGGSLAVTRGSKINALGTAGKPIIFTSTNDTATWTGGDPRTGNWRAAASEWGNLTIMGSAYISEDAGGLNSHTCSSSNEANMEGLSVSADSKYGGGDDDDDSGTVKYVSLRYGGRVVVSNNELNGLSLGGIGRETDIHHIDIMNNVDDGVEIWGGTVNLSYLNIWNIGDDSMDVDQGWRGKSQFGLIVQGYSVDATQGSGVGDNCFETDGAEDSYYQPVTTAKIYNWTVIGNPVIDATLNTGDHGTAWRDNARVQYRNCIFMDLGDRLVSFDNVDGDGGDGYGVTADGGATLSWAATWTTDWNAAPSHPNDCSFSDIYKAQTDGKLAEIKDSVFYNNDSSGAYTEASSRGVLAGGNNNVKEPASSPIRSIGRASVASLFGGQFRVQRVISLDPRGANDALTPVATAPADGFFKPAQFRGAFDACNNWIRDWTAADAYGFVVRTKFTCSDKPIGDAGTRSVP